MSDLVVLYSLKKADDIICPPFALMFLSSALKKAGYRVKVFHCSLEDAECNIASVVAEEPLFIGFSLFTGLYCKYSAILSRKIKSLNSSIPVVWGGVHASLLPEQCLKEDYIDIIVYREGEESVVDVANCLKNKQSLREVRGVGFKEDDKLIINEKRQFIRNLDEFPLDWDCINVEDYIEHRTRVVDGKEGKLRSIGYYSSRGCPFNCAFCYNLGYNDRTWRSSTAQTVIADINRLKDKYNINHVLFWDDLFFVNKKRALDILNGIDIPTHTEVRLDFVTEETAKLYKDAKVLYFLIGAESGSDRLLKLINKGFDAAFMIEKAKILAKHNILAQYSFILGLPTETREETFQTIDQMYTLYRIHPDASFTVGIFMPYPGTSLYQLAINEGYVPPSTTEAWETVDRWRNTVKLPWIDGLLCLNIRIMFALLTDSSTPWFFRKWIELRIQRKWMHLKYDLKFMCLMNSLIKDRGYKIYSLKANWQLLREIVVRLFAKATTFSEKLPT